MITALRALNDRLWEMIRNNSSFFFCFFFVFSFFIFRFLWRLLERWMREKEKTGGKNWRFFFGVKGVGQIHEKKISERESRRELRRIWNGAWWMKLTTTRSKDSVNSGERFLKSHRVSIESSGKNLLGRISEVCQRISKEKGGGDDDDDEEEETAEAEEEAEEEEGGGGGGKQVLNIELRDEGHLQQRYKTKGKRETQMNGIWINRWWNLPSNSRLEHSSVLI